MTKAKLIEELVDFATFLVIASQDAGEEQKKQFVLADSEDNILTSFYKGKRQAYDTAFAKLNKILKEAKE